MSRSLYQIQKSVLLLSFSSLSGAATANGIADPLVLASAIDGSVLRRFILFLIFFNIVACLFVCVCVCEIVFYFVIVVTIRDTRDTRYGVYEICLFQCFSLNDRL